ncbi:5332_t:CDS:1, partial [Gigaspora rosea]
YVMCVLQAVGMALLELTFVVLFSRVIALVTYVVDCKLCYMCTTGCLDGFAISSWYIYV